MYDVKVGTRFEKDGQEGTRWIKVGEAYERNNSIVLRLDAPIIHDTGSCTWLNLFVKETKRGISQEDELQKKS